MREDALDALWGGTVESWSFTVKGFRLAAVVAVVDKGVRRSYRVTLDGISGWHFLNKGPTSWDYVELTSIAANTRGEVTLEFWNGVATATIRCESFMVDPV